MGDTGICAAFSDIVVAIGLHQPSARLALLGFNQTKEIFLILSLIRCLGHQIYPGWPSLDGAELTMVVVQKKLYLGWVCYNQMLVGHQIYSYCCIYDKDDKDIQYRRVHLSAELWTCHGGVVKYEVGQCEINWEKRVEQGIKIKQQEERMRYTIIEQPLQGGSHYRLNRSGTRGEAHYVQRLRQVLENNRRSNHYYANEISPKPLKLRDVASQRYETQKSENEESIVYVVKQPAALGSGIHLPKLKKKSRPPRYADIQNNQKLIIRNYMNAKLIQFKNSPKKSPKARKRRNYTIDSVGELPENSHKKYYKYQASTPIESLNRGASESYPISGQSNQLSSRTESMDYAYNPHRNNQYLYPAHNSRSHAKAPSMGAKPEQSPPRRSIVNDYSDSHYQDKAVKSIQPKETNKQQQWELIDPLNLETYFVKMKKIVNGTPEQSKLEKTKLKIPKIPSREQMSNFIKNYVPEFQQIKIDHLIKADSFQIIQDESNGQVTFYFGETKNDKKHGKGIFITDRSYFQGLWVLDLKQKGIQVTEMGEYKGEFKEGIRSGKGEFFWSHGQYYSGEWKNGKKNGSGYWKSMKGESYMGEWKNGQVTGYGVHTMKSGQKYEGEFVNFLKHGFGKEAFPNGDNYQGRYVQGQPHGKGKYTWKNGTVYEGEFVEGFRQGKGIINAPNRLRFQGSFKDEHITGIGRLESSNGDVFNGIFENNKKNGHGVLDLKSQRRIIKGIWENNELVRQQEQSG